MTTKRIVYETPGGLTIVTPNRKNRGKDESEDKFLARVWAREKEVAPQITADCWVRERDAEGKPNGKLVNVGGRVFNPHLMAKTSYVIIDVSEIPTDRSKRNSWRLKDGKIVVGG